MRVGVLVPVASLSVSAWVGCTAPNPDFGDSATSTSASGTGTDPSTSTTIAPPTTSVSVTSDDPSMTSDSDPTSSGTVEPSTTGEPSFECCGQENCSPAVTSCICELANEACCSGAWDETCPGIAIACGGVCDGVVYPCCEPQPMAACTGVQTIGGFCFSHANCCLIEWTASCIPDYDAATGACGLESCEVPHATPGCNDAETIQCVCDQIPQCCTEQWHPACVEAAAECG